MKRISRSLLLSSMDSALLAVEIYNKPRVTFKVESYILLMIIAWNKLFLAYFSEQLGERYYFMKGNRYERVSGEKKAWDLITCMNKYTEMDQKVKANLDFLIGLRNRIVHRNIDDSIILDQIFGECQAMLYNYEDFLVKLFGEEYSINSSLAFAMQFSNIKTIMQKEANRKIMSREVQDVISYVNKYRESLSDEIYDSQIFSIKVLIVPRISNTNRNDVAIEFLKWDSLSEEQKTGVNKIYGLIKTKVEKIEGLNIGKLKPGQVVSKVKEGGLKSFSHHGNEVLWKVFKIRPLKDCEDPFKTDIRYCYYDEAHKDYVYCSEWVDFILNILIEKKYTIQFFRNKLYREEYLNIENFI